MKNQNTSTITFNYTSNEPFCTNNQENHIKNFVYECSCSQHGSNQTQSIDMINLLTANAPIISYMKQDGVYQSLVVPSWTEYLFVENGWLMASGSRLCISQEYLNKNVRFISRSKLEKRLAKTKQPIGNRVGIDNMTEIYIFEDISQLTPVARLSGLQSQYSPKVYVLDKSNNIILIEQADISHKNLVFLRKRNRKQLTSQITS